MTDDTDTDEDIDYRPWWARGGAGDVFRLVSALLLVGAMLAVQAAFWGDWRCAVVRCALFPFADADTDGDRP